MPRAKKETDRIMNPKVDGRNYCGQPGPNIGPPKAKQTAAVGLGVGRRRLRTGTSAYPAPMN